ncbi:MBL fold metallo-hydrolase [Neorhizobium sp. NCHU2750]|uniref:MBL fold metallo-hydrolase n=1 Tax=Neorhizobium sp. NCHU2750 TaxID=1825976 RepID=UPI000E70D95A|nr:beta-lactamase [Neorhizobium sp. NCHU2750]
MTDKPGMIDTLRILNPAPGIFAYYDGRIAGRRLYSEKANWLDDGAYSLGVASYAIVDGRQALIHDTHISLDHARAIRAHVEGLGARDIRVVLSHWHDDHIAGNAVFADCEIISLKLTADRLTDNRAEIEKADPPICPLVMPTTTFEERLDLSVGRRRVELAHFAIHSADGNVIRLSDEGLMLAGDTVEDTITYISEPEEIARHIDELERMAKLPIERILPAHGDPQRIADGGYARSLIRANQSYLHRLTAAISKGETVEPSLKSFIADDLASGAAIYFEPYEAVHEKNIARVKTALGK